MWVSLRHAGMVCVRLTMFDASVECRMCRTFNLCQQVGKCWVGVVLHLTERNLEKIGEEITTTLAGRFSGGFSSPAPRDT
jgi:hypothetical protein